MNNRSAATGSHTTFPPPTPVTPVVTKNTSLPSLSTLALIPYLLFFALFAQTLSEIARICWHNEDYSHGLLLPFLSAYVVRERCRLDPPAHTVDTSLSLLGIALLLLGSTGYVFGSLGALLFPLWASCIVTLLGIHFLVFGRAIGLVLTAPTLLLFMAKPLPDSLIPKLFWPLQVLAAWIGGESLALLNVPVHMVGNIIEIPGMRLMVEEACSGIRSLLALLTVAFIVALLVPMTPLKRGGIVLLSVVTAVFLNVVRVALTGVLAHFYDPESATGFFHTFSGMVVFLLGLAIVYGAASLLRTDTAHVTKINH